MGEERLISIIYRIAVLTKVSAGAFLDRFYCGLGNGVLAGHTQYRPATPATIPQLVSPVFSLFLEAPANRECSRPPFKYSSLVYIDCNTSSIAIGPGFLLPQVPEFV